MCLPILEAHLTEAEARQMFVDMHAASQYHEMDVPTLAESAAFPVVALVVAAGSVVSVPHFSLTAPREHQP